MTNEEWDALSFYLPTAGRPPRDRRRTWDAIFRIATSTDPWAALPPEFGNPYTAHSALIHAARAGRLERMLIAASGHPLAPDGMVALAWRIACAVRRASRQWPPHVLELAHRLGFDAALPFDPALMPEWRDRRPDAPPAAFRDLRLPRIPRRALRGLAPPRGFAPKAVAAPKERPPAPRRRPRRPGRPAIHAVCPKPPRARRRTPGGA
jgi:hypothetical protein